MELSLEQKKALDCFRNGENIFVTGPGGSGKSELIRHIIMEGNKQNKQIQVCALTGCATVLLKCKNAKTIHSWSGVGLANGPDEKVIERVLRNRYKKKAWKQVDVLIVDEVSMMSLKLFDLLDMIGRKTRKNVMQPFGGIQLVFSGDFYQLPPVGNDEDSSAFCFESRKWKPTFSSVISLMTVFRQTDSIYIKILNQIRQGRLSKSSYERLCSRVGVVCDHSDIRPTVLLPRRRDVDILNKREFDKLTSTEKTFIAKPASDLTGAHEYSQQQRDIEYNYLKNNLMAESTIVLKVGTQVMCVANISTDVDYPLVNGSQGIVIGFTPEGLPIVKFHNGCVRPVAYHSWVSENMPSVGIMQIPLIYAWAITIHKAQGVSLDLAEIDVGNGIFECGQTYVALSRVKSLDGLFLTALNPQKIKVKQKVKSYYATMDDDTFQKKKTLFEYM